jgi:hypothetical protein
MGTPELGQNLRETEKSERDAQHGLICQPLLGCHVPEISWTSSRLPEGPAKILL